MGVSNLRKTI
ncbi:hypothetical protein Avbf_07831, partial [Armadillidium vulgare]